MLIFRRTRKGNRCLKYKVLHYLQIIYFFYEFLLCNLFKFWTKNILNVAVNAIRKREEFWREIM